MATMVDKDDMQKVSEGPSPTVTSDQTTMGQEAGYSEPSIVAITATPKIVEDTNVEHPQGLGAGHVNASNQATEGDTSISHVEPVADSIDELGGDQPAPLHQTEPAFSINGLDVDSSWGVDPELGGEDRSSTESVRSSVYRDVEEIDRHYHKFKEGKYYLPYDEIEQDRLDLQHRIFLLALDGKLQISPIDEIKGGIHNVLDFGTGTGKWAIEFATTYPSANVVGTDLSPIQPHYVPQNCHFEVSDAEDPWLFSQKFDFIHGRMLCSCFSSHLNVFRSAFGALAPGGWIELQDFVFPFNCIDDSMKDTAFERWLDLILAGIRALGKDFGRAVQYKQYLHDCGFVDVHEKLMAWPIGSWPKDERMKVLGAWNEQNALQGMRGWSMGILTRGLGMTSEEAELLVTEVRDCISSRKLHAYIQVHFVYGRKPEES